ncbi:hypothetical protein RHS01_09253 [Rhizoctonia solani]|uniref:Transmembrane protein n=1 Tax=Rhizoctonia solani TaxID=456999 RepID=A0A8H7I6U3_9AGAM|nr:hypothetical protein RHS01_09253 [Rhizoctonia solani]
MQFKSAFSRLAAFALFMLSFSMLTCAAPAPAPAALAVARTSEPATCSSLAPTSMSILTSSPIVAQIVADIQVCIDIIAKLTGTIDVKLSVIVQLVVSIIVVSTDIVCFSLFGYDWQPTTKKIATACGKWVVKLGLTVYLEIFASIDASLSLWSTSWSSCLCPLSSTSSLPCYSTSLLLTAHLTALIKLLGL